MLHAGYACIPMPDPVGLPLKGYTFRKEKGLSPGSDGMLDPLCIRVLALHDGEAPAVLVSLDLCVLETGTAQGWREGIAERLGVEPARVLLACTHTHHAPDLTADSASLLPASYVGLVESAIREGVSQALGLLLPVRIGIREAACGLGYNRRVPVEEGVAHCWNPSESPDCPPQPASDPVCTVIRLEPVAGGRPILLWGMGMHPVVLGKTCNLVSGDYPGRACAKIAERAGMRSLFCLGAAGDTHPWIATQEDPGGLECVAEAVASQVILMASTLACEVLETPILVRSVRTEAGHDLVGWRIGSVALAAVSGEVFGSLGAAFRRAVGEPVLLSTCTNGWSGYWPDGEGFKRGGYEVGIAETFGIEPGMPEAWMGRAAEMFCALRAEAERGDGKPKDS